MTDLPQVAEQLKDHLKSGLEGAQQAAQAATRQVAPELEALARFGYASKGVLYGTLGFLALSVAVGRGGATTDTKGTLIRLSDLPAGHFLMWALVLGLVGYALWQLIRAALDPEGQGSGGKGLLKRAGYLISGGANLALAVFAVRLAATGNGARTQNSTASAAQSVLHLPGGQVVLALAGLALLGLAVNQLYVAYGAKFMKRMAFRDIAARHRQTLKRVGQVGIGSRGVLSGIIGVFLLIAALHHRASDAVGISQALAWLRHEPAGNVLLGAVALGTLCYGVWCVVQARYRRIRLAGETN